MTNRELRNLSLGLILISLAIYALDYRLFGHARTILSYLLMELGFLPLSVLIVTVVINRLLVGREKAAQRYKMNMVISAFFSAVGTPLLRLLGALAPAEADLHERLAIDPGWDEPRLREAIAYLRATRLPVEATPEKLAPLRTCLADHREFMMRLLENPVLLEHGQFTNLLWAVFHLEEELAARPSLDALPPSDLNHLAGDVDRALSRLLRQWLEHMIHLRRDYPFLFSFEARTNPLRPGAKAEIES